MWDFSDDEWIFLVLAAVVCVAGIWRWYAPLLAEPGVGPSRVGIRLVFALTPLPAMGLLLGVLRYRADPLNVAGHFDYEILFMVGGAALLGLAGFILPSIGISPRDDAIHRGNTSAVIVVVGAMFGLILAYAGGNVGWGPTIWTTLVPAALAAGILFSLTAMLLMVGSSLDSVMIDRDPGAGLRVGSFEVAAGVILGRAVAGDWEGWPGMFNDLLRLGWPAILLFALMAGVNRWARPSPARPRPSIWRFGFVPTVAILALTIVYIMQLGSPEVLTAAQRVAVTEGQH